MATVESTADDDRLAEGEKSYQTDETTPVNENGSEKSSSLSVDPNYNPYRAGNPTDSLLGRQSVFSRRMKRKIDYELHEVIFLVLAIVSMCAAVGFSIYRMEEEYSEPSPKDKASFTFAVLIVFNAAYLIIYAVHGIVFEHLEEMVAFAVASAVVFIYVAVDYGQHRSTADPVKLARFILVMVGFPVLAAFSLYCAKQFRWLKFRVAGATEEKQKMYTTFCRMESLLLFDFQIAVSLFILVLYRGSSVDTLETILLCAGLVYCLAWAILGYYATRTEHMVLTSIFMVLSVLLPAYIAFKIVRLVQRWDMYIEDGIQQLAFVFYVAAGLGLLVRSILIFVVEEVRRNFKKGLWSQVG